MRSSTRTLLLAVAGALSASVVQGQGVFTTPPDTTIGVQLQVVPFSPAPRPAPQVFFIGPAESRLTCPMPVFTGGSGADRSILVVPAPVGASDIRVEESPATGCRNPLFRPPVTRVFVW